MVRNTASPPCLPYNATVQASIQVVVRDYLAREARARLEEARLQRLIEMRRREEERTLVEMQLMRKEEMYMLELREREGRAMKVSSSVSGAGSSSSSTDNSLGRDIVL